MVFLSLLILAATDTGYDLLEGVHGCLVDPPEDVEPSLDIVGIVEEFNGSALPRREVLIVIPFFPPGTIYRVELAISGNARNVLLEGTLDRLPLGPSLDRWVIARHFGLTPFLALTFLSIFSSVY